MSSSESQEGKDGGSGNPLNPISLGIQGGRGLRDVRNFLIIFAVSIWAKSSSISPGSYSIMKNIYNEKKIEYI